MLAGFTFLVIAATILSRTPFEGLHFEPRLFWSWRVWDRQKWQIISNIIMFIPIGVLGGKLWGWKGIWFAAGLSVFIEVLQLVTARGLCEFDDVVHNMVGAVVGIGAVTIIRRHNQFVSHTGE